MTIGDERVRALASELDATGDLPAGFGSLLQAVPRELFLPDRIWVDDAEGDDRPVDRLAQPERWLAAVYANKPVVTQFDDGRTTWPRVGDRPTCSASMPSVVVGMLDALDLTAGHSVLEVGTGTGYNAALVSEIVGTAGTVTTVEIDPTLAAMARKRLNAAGYGRVDTVVGDATHGAASRAPFDRIIATMAVPLGRVPYSWVEQTRPGGIIVTPIRADLASGPLVRFTVHDDGTATGRTLPMGVAFMESRSQRTARTPGDDVEWEQDGTAERVTTVKPWPFLGTPSSRWALAVALPSCRYDIEPSTETRPYKRAWLRDPVSDSWASVVPVGDGKYLVRQTGIRRLWNEAETVHHWWVEKGQPAITDWRWTITPDRQSIGLP